MIWHVSQGSWSRVALAAALSGWAIPAALAGEAAYCVHCTGPDQTYVCKVSAGGGKPSDALKLYCVIRTAKDGHHAACSAERVTSDCNGVEKVYSYDGPLPEDLAADPRVKKLTKKIEEQEDAFDKPKSDSKAPKTLVELGGRAVNASKQRWRGTFGGGSSSDAALPGDSSLAAEEQNTALAAQSAPVPPPEVSHPNRVQRAYRCMMSFFRNCSSDPAEGEPIR
jgi:hypothetical protein